VYLMVDPQLRPVAGNVPAWPKEGNQDKWFYFKSRFRTAMKPASTKCARGRFICRAAIACLVGHDVQERQDVKSLMMRGLIAAVVLTLLMGLGGGFGWDGASWRRRGPFSASQPRSCARFVATPAGARCHDEINTLAREINTMLDKIEQLTLGMRTVLDSAAHDLRTR